MSPDLVFFCFLLKPYMKLNGRGYTSQLKPGLSMVRERSEQGLRLYMVYWYTKNRYFTVLNG